MTALAQWLRRHPRRSLEGMPRGLVFRLLWAAAWRVHVRCASLLLFLFGVAFLPIALYHTGTQASVFAMKQGWMSEQQFVLFWDELHDRMFPFGVVVMMTWLIAWLWAGVVLEVRVMRQTLKEMLLEKGLRPTFCFDCGYNLRGTEGDTCPECGCRIASTK